MTTVTKKLKMLAKVYNGATPKSDNPSFWDGDIAWATPVDLDNSRYINRTKRTITVAGYSSCNTHILEPGNIIISNRAPIGLVAINEVAMCTNQGCKAIEVNEKQINVSYLYYVLASSVRVLNSLGTGTTFMEISSDALKNFRIPFVNIDEQERIVDKLDSKTAVIDKMIAVKKRTHAQLSELRNSIITDAVLRHDTDAISTKTHPWVGLVPAHWKITKLSHLARIKTGGTPNKDEPEYWEGGTIPWLASGEVNKGIINNVDGYITAAGFANSNATILPIDTVMIALNGQGKTKGMTALLKTPATCNQSLAGIICNSEVLDPTYLYYYFKCKYYDIRGIKGEARDGLNLELIGSIPIPIPQLDEQRSIVWRIESRIKKLDIASTKLKNSIDLMEEYRTSLISNVISGKVEV